MNKNKIIFLIITAILGILVFIGILQLKDSSSDTGMAKKSNEFQIWIVEDDRNKFLEFIEDFKLAYPQYKGMFINVESFASYDDYYLALASAVSKGKGPDIFVLNNNEKTSVFSEQVLGIDPEIISPNDFRKKFKGVFSDDLIARYNEEDKEKEFLIGVPVGYETLGIFYNRRYIKSSDLSSFSSLNNVVSELKEKNPSLVPIGIGNGSTVDNIADIVTQFFMLESGVTNLTDVIGNKLKQSLATYLLFGDEKGDNAYNSRFVELRTLGQNNLDLFAKGQAFMVVGYPRLINTIDKNGFSKSFLRADPFPHYYSGEGKTLLNYNYFAMNKNTVQYDLALDFLSYLTEDIGATNFLNKYPYYLPALLSLESDRMEEKIHPEYNVVLENFYNPNFILSSFDKGIKTAYDKEIISILDNSSNYENEFESFRSRLVCRTKKITSLENLSAKCE